MKKIISVLAGILLVCALVFPVLADGVPVIFTADSKAEPGSTLTVDKYAMLDHEENSSESYNALLEGTVLYRWFKDGKQVKEGKKELSYKVTQEDVGSQIYVQVLFFGDLDLTVDWGSVKSEVFTVTDPNAAPTEAPTQAPTEAPTQAPAETTAPVTSAPATPADPQPQPEAGTPWWAVLLIAIVSAGLGIGVAVALVNKKSK